MWRNSPEFTPLIRQNLWQRIKSTSKQICEFKLDIFLIQNQFQQEFLDPPNTMFKTTNIGSFIRQLNLYGFRKLNVVRFAETTPDMREVHEFQNDFFHRGRPDLLAYLKRNVGIRRTRDLAVKRRLETMESGSAVKLPRYAPQVSLSAPSFFITFGLLFRWSESERQENLSVWRFVYTVCEWKRCHFQMASWEIQLTFHIEQHQRSSFENGFRPNVFSEWSACEKLIPCLLYVSFSISSQGLNYIPPFLRRHHDTVGSAGFPTTSLMYQSTATGKWPIYMHWDKSCGVCKYVVLPDTGSNTLPSSINGNPVVYSPVQGPDGKYYPVVKRKYTSPPEYGQFTVNIEYAVADQGDVRGCSRWSCEIDHAPKVSCRAFMFLVLFFPIPESTANTNAKARSRTNEPQGLTFYVFSWFWHVLSCYKCNKIELTFYVHSTRKKSGWPTTRVLSG